jgi:cytoskeleton protein RodZ
MAKIPQLSLVEENQIARARLNADLAPGDVDLPVTTVGEDLSRARQKKGKELTAVWRVLKIRPEYLVAIERSDFEVLPDRAHTIGFVRSYAAYLGLDAKEVVGRWKEETASYWASKKPPIDLLPQIESEIPQDPAIAAEGRANAPAIDFSPQAEGELSHGGWGMAVVPLVGLIYAGFYLFGSAGNTAQPVTPVPVPVVADATAEPPQGNVAELLPAAPVERASAAQAPVPAPPPEPSSAVLGSSEVVAVPVESPPKLVAPLPRGQEYGIGNKTSRITLRVHRSTRVAVEGARKHMFIDLVLVPGDTYRVPNIAGVKLNTQDAGAVELIVDGTSMGFAGQDGVKANGVSLSPQTIIARQQRG